MQNWICLLVAAVFAALLLAVVHLAGLLKRQPLSRPAAYVLGVAVLLAAFWLWAWWVSLWQAALAMTVITAAGGMAVLGLWTVNAKRMPRESWPGERMKPAELRTRMIELLENSLATRAVIRDLRGEADELEGQMDVFLMAMRNPATWKPDTSYADVQRAARKGRDDEQP